ncbi:MAG: hypothetical protein ACHQ0I_04480 [Candidatus Lutacidiplasmatales archaeon]
MKSVDGIKKKEERAKLESTVPVLLQILPPVFTISTTCPRPTAVWTSGGAQLQLLLAKLSPGNCRPTETEFVAGGVGTAGGFAFDVPRAVAGAEATWEIPTNWAGWVAPLETPKPFVDAPVLTLREGPAPDGCDPALALDAVDTPEVRRSIRTTNPAAATYEALVTLRFIFLRHPRVRDV